MKALTPEIIVDCCKRCLSEAQVRFVLETTRYYPEAVALATAVHGENTFSSDQEVAEWMVGVCETARRGGVA